MAELALDHDERDALVSHFDGVRMAKLMRSEPTPHTSGGRRLPQLRAGGCRRPRPDASRAIDDAEQGSDGKLEPALAPRLKLLPPPLIHADLPAPTAFTAAHEHRTAAAIEIRLAERERLVDPEPGSPKHDDQRAQPPTINAVPRRSHDGDDLFDRRRVGGITDALVARRRPAWKRRLGATCRATTPRPS